MGHLGEYLIGQGALSRFELEEALRSKVASGGRLGTNLVELGFLELNELGRHLSRLHGVALPPDHWLEDPQREALDLLPTELVRELCVLPLCLEGKTLHVAMLDPNDPQTLSEVAINSGRRVEAYLLPELRLLYAIERHLGVARPERFRSYSRDRQVGASQAPVVLPPPEPRDTDVVGGLTEHEELIDDESFARLQEHLVAAREQSLGSLLDVAPRLETDSAARTVRVSGDGSVTLAQLERDLAEAQNRDAVIDGALALALRFSRAAALFLVHGGMVMGHRGAGEGLERRVSGVLVPLDAQSLLAEAARSAQGWRGPPPGGVDARVLQALGREDAEEVAALPVCIRGRVVNVLYADGGGDVLGDIAWSALEAICERLAQAYEGLILRAKERD